jgi:methyl-accepting chemotaxis protein
VGRVRSIFYPVKDANGNTVLTIGIDYPIETVRKVIIRSYMMFGGIILFIIIVTVIVARRLRGRIVVPISSIISEVTNISENADLRLRTSVSGNDEIGMLAQNFNRFIEKSQGIIRQISDISMRLASSSEEFSSISVTCRSRKRISRMTRLTR